ncbi:hypothetical protein PA0349 [Candidatus Phytoplasma australiense]|uniref:Uncharacterized protein n=2 Tax=Phytoplasma australiense TaxID=59748 RepID=B1V9R2_PHYAS|nr:hypothetical protein [Candidatus Phytoplasma australiense]AGL90124.1 Hypothetical Protein SLY_0201 [Strawberry lethal yellows phytoplasma (CPA) str. NZSb11]CAM11684.1 hypothetical protein PA0349 [Candidatus Phytoplasma australiense]
MIYGRYQNPEGTIKKLIIPDKLHVDFIKNNKDIIETYNIDEKQSKEEIKKAILSKWQTPTKVELNIYNSNIREWQKENVEIAKSNPGSYFSLLLKNSNILSDVLDYDNYIEYEEIKIIEGENAEEVPSDLRYKKINNEDHTYQYHFNDGTIEKYNQDGKLQEVEYSKNNIIFSYDGSKWSFKLKNSDLQPINLDNYI